MTPASTDPVLVDDLLAGFTRDELDGWAAVGTALRRWANLGAPYAAIPFALSKTLNVPAYPLDHLAPVVDPEGRYCGLTGFYRDEAAAVDWWCLLGYDHDGPHGWERDRLPVLDSIAAGYRPEVDDVDDELAEMLNP